VNKTVLAIATVLTLGCYNGAGAQQVYEMEPPFPQSDRSWSNHLYLKKLNGEQCPHGQVYKITAGSGSGGVARQYQCVPWPGQPVPAQPAR
jgi:hypothetical protein